MSASQYTTVPGDNARENPTRLLVVQEETRPAVDVHEDTMVMTFPHLVVVELIVLIAASLFLTLLALFFDAPLEELANPLKTPNPAKAPWYFLGLQELLHYYPPVVSGVILPGLVMVALAVIPYFKINVARAPFWDERRQFKMVALWVSIAVLSLVFAFSGAHPIWACMVPTWLVGLLMTWPAITGGESGFSRWLATRSLPTWLFVWFLIVSVVLTVIGVFFRGPGWSFVLPWVDGIYY